VQVGNDEETLVFVLQPDAVGQGANVVAEVQLACRPVPSQDSLLFHRYRLTIPQGSGFHKAR